jgi:hypothetical protein
MGCWNGKRDEVVSFAADVEEMFPAIAPTPQPGSASTSPQVKGLEGFYYSSTIISQNRKYRLITESTKHLDYG